jgi:aromatic ring-opening dioxygenase LigB subunit
LGENRKDNRQIKFRVSDLEFQNLEQMATDFGMSVPSFCKKKAQGVKMRPPKIDREGAFEIAKELRAIGVNVNQLARKANEGRNISALEVEAVERQLNEIWQQFNSARQR